MHKLVALIYKTKVHGNIPNIWVKSNSIGNINYLPHQQDFLQFLEYL